MAADTQTKFGSWLSGELSSRGLGVRTFARMIEPDLKKLETVRRNLIRYIHEGVQPGATMRKRIADGLGVAVSELPSDGDEEDE